MSDTMMRLTGIHLDTPLKFVRSEDYRSVYYRSVHDTVDGDEVYVQHGTGKVFEPVDLCDVDLDHMWRRYVLDAQDRIPYIGYGRDEFLDTLRAQLYDSDDVEQVKFCADCGEPGHEDDTFGTGRGDVVCSSCRDEYFWCYECDELWPDGHANSTVGNDTICDRCRDRNWTYCDYCDGYRRDDEYYNHDHGDNDDDEDEGDTTCNPCESPVLSFTIRNDGMEPLANDTRVTVSLPAGVISAEGIGEIAQYLRTYSYNNLVGDESYQLTNLSYRLDELDDKWQTREGNFTKRLSRFAYKEYGLKVAPEVISQVGCIARDQSTAVDHEIEITRNVNLPREAFAHPDSCWWTSYSESRCALKTNGGFGIRTFGEPTNAYDVWSHVKGRAWVMPLRKTVDYAGRDTLTPTFETQDPDAYVVFNGYGNLEGYAPARILSHMVGMTYRKISFDCSPMYVNNSSGYLVAPEEIATHYTDGSLSLSVEQHSNLYRDEKVLSYV